MNALDHQRGAALVATLAIIMVLMPLGAFVLFQNRTDWLMHHNLRGEVQVFYVAEAGLEHALSEVGPGTTFSDTLTGPDHTAGTADDGLFPFREGGAREFPQAPFRYDVRVVGISPSLIRIISQGSGPGESAKVVEALVTRSVFPDTPAAVYAAGGASILDLGTQGFALSGLDHAIGDAPDQARGSAPSIAALAGPFADPSAVAAALPASSAMRLSGAGGVPSIAAAAPVDLGAVAAASADRPNRVLVSAPAADTDLVLGTSATPQLSVVAGNLDVGANLTGSGILIVEGVLHVSGTMNFTGLVLATAGVVFDASSTSMVTGGLWVDASRSGRMQFSGTGAVVYSRAALAAADGAFPGLLPHAAVVVGWQEQL